MTTNATVPRGIRNNNPGNIDRDGTQWEGMAAAQTDPRFVVFVDPQHGIRALGRILVNYQVKHHLNTVAGLIGRWAPPSENPTQSYVDFVARRLGVGPADPVDVTNPATLTALDEAIVAEENADYAYPAAVVQAGVALALGLPVPA